MNIDYISGELTFDAQKNTHYPIGTDKIKIKSNLVYSIEKISINFMQICLEFVCLKSLNYFFFFQDERIYNELLRAFYDNRKELKKYW